MKYELQRLQAFANVRLEQHCNTSRMLVQSCLQPATISCHYVQPAASEEAASTVLLAPAEVASR